MCGERFVSKYNRERHQENFHKDESDSEMEARSSSEEASNVTISEVDEETSNTTTSEDDDEQKSEEPMSEDEDENTTTAYKDLITESIDNHSNEKDELVTRFMEVEDCDEDLVNRKANLMILPKARKTLRQLFVNYVIGMYRKRHDPLMKAILKKYKEFQEEGFTHHEAIKAAVAYRKYQIYDLIVINEAQPDSDEMDSGPDSQ